MGKWAVAGDKTAKAESAAQLLDLYRKEIQDTRSAVSSLFGSRRGLSVNGSKDKEICSPKGSSTKRPVAANSN